MFLPENAENISWTILDLSALRNEKRLAPICKCSVKVKRKRYKLDDFIILLYNF